MCFSAMAGIAGHLVIAVESVGIDALHHLEHLAGDHFFVFVVTGKIPCDMAALAFHPGACDERSHYGANFLRLDQLQILRCPHSAATAPSGRSDRWFLSTQGNTTNRKKGKTGYN